jgi:ABC-type dipeptide/oligopeptide/nickel transport system permease component
MWSLFQGNQQNRVIPYEAQIFWMALILCPVLWIVFFLIALFGFKFKWLVSTRTESKIVGKFTDTMPCIMVLSYVEFCSFWDHNDKFCIEVNDAKLFSKDDPVQLSSHLENLLALMTVLISFSHLCSLFL